MKLRIESGPLSGKTYQLSQSKEYSIGRDKGDIKLKDEAKCADPHARLLVRNGNWHVIDEMTVQGTIVNGKPINFAELNEGSTITIGSTVMRVLSLSLSSEKGQAPRPASVTVTPQPKPVAVVTSAPMAPPVSASQPVGQRPKAQAPLPRQTGSNSALIAAVIGLLALAVLAVIAFTGPSPGGEDTSARNDGPESEPLSAEFARRLDNAEAKQDAYLRLAALYDLKKEAKNFSPLKEDEARLDEAYRRTLKKYASQVDLDTRPAIVRGREALEKGKYKVAMEMLLDARTRLSDGDEVWIVALKETGNDTALESLIVEVKEANQELIKQKFTDARSLEVVSWWSEAAVVYSEVAAQAWFGPEELADLERKIAQLRNRPSTDYVSRFANGTGWTKKQLDDAKADANGDPIAEPEQPVEGDLVVVADAPKVDFAPFPSDLTAHLGIFVQALLVPAQESVAGNLRVELEGKSWKADHVDTAGWTLSKGADKRYLGWPETPEALLWTLSGKLEPSISNDAGLTILLAFGNRLESASRAVYASVARDPANSEKAQAFLAHLLGISVPQGGFAVLGGRYVTPETIEAIETQRKVDALVATFTKGLGKRETLAMRKKSDAAFDELLTLGELAIKPTVDVLTGARALAFEKIEKSTGLASRDSDTLKKLVVELEKRRKRALELIFDEVKWPYPYGPDNAKITAEVMERVEAVREIWENPLKAVGRASPKIQETIELVRDLNKRLMQIDPLLQHHESTGIEDMEYMASLANKALSIKNFAATAKDRAALARWNDIMEGNAKRREASKGNAKAPDDEAWEQLLITNDYRMMMGIAPMKMNDKLFWAAKHHSQWCVEHNGGQISHDSPGGPRGNNPSERAAFENYSSGVGENIHMNGMGPTPMSSHLSWLGSSGHHRNILNPGWTVMGNGRFGSIWTQNFGSADEGKGNEESKGGA